MIGTALGFNFNSSTINFGQKAYGYYILDPYMLSLLPEKKRFNFVQCILSASGTINSIIMVRPC